MNQFSIGIDVFDRDSSFDPAIDSIVRVEAGRIRAKLAEFYLGEGQSDSVLIGLPKGGYAVDVQFRQQPVTSENRERRPGTWWLIPAVVAGVVAAALVAALLVLRPGPEPVTAQNPSSTANPGLQTGASQEQGRKVIAVLPFDNMSADPEQEYFSDGITEDIITDLSIVSRLRVIARHSTFIYKGQPVSIRDVGEDLGVDYIVEGSVRKHDGRLRITAQLIDVATESHVWAERFDRVLDDVFEIQDEVSSKIVSALEIALTDRERARLDHRNTLSLKAHDHYLRGQEQFYRFDKDSVIRSIGHFTEAIEIDPSFAEAYAWKSRALVYALISGFTPDTRETIDQAIRLAREAIDRDSLLPMAHANLAWAMRWDRQIEGSAEAVSRAIELDRNFADAYLWQSLILSTGKRGRESLDAIEEGLRLNPNYGVTYIFALGRAYFALDDMTSALQQFERGIERNPHFLPNHLYRMFALEKLGDDAGAEQVKAGLKASHPRFEKSASYRHYFMEWQ